MEGPGFFSSSSVSIGQRRRRRTLEEIYASQALLRADPPYRPNYDRFIPDRSSMDMDVARHLLTEKEIPPFSSPSKEAYRRLLRETLLGSRTRIFSFGRKPPPVSATTIRHPKPSTPNPRRYISQSAERILDAPDLVNDYSLNLLDWGLNNIISIALDTTIYLWDASTSSTAVLAELDHASVTSVGWAPDGVHIAAGLANSDVQIWDANTARLLRTLRAVHRSRVGALAWNDHLLATGGMDGLVASSDMRIRSPVVRRYRGHRQEVCGLRWSGSGQHLASGGNDSLVRIWDRSMDSRSLHRFEDHTAAVKALAWCPSRSNLLTSGGGASDHCIKFWNIGTGKCEKSVDAGSQVSALLWNRTGRELLSAQGNELVLRRYPSMARMADLKGHIGHVLFLAQSPDGCKVASAGGDERLMIWKVFEETAKKTSATTSIFKRFDHIR